MVGVFVIVAAVATALLIAASARVDSLVSALLTAYLVLVLNAVGVTLLLSPFQLVTRAGLAAAEGVLLVGALAGWWLSGRSGVPLRAARAALAEVVRSPPATVFVILIGALLAYEFVLGLTVPPNNWDSLTYHLARAAAWKQHGGYFWIPNAPTDRLNEFQPVAEQELLFLFAATGTAALFAMPQFFAGVVILVAVYGASRRLGFAVWRSVCGACLLATFSLVALEATTAQNDLVAASFPVIAAYLLLSGSRFDAILAGLAISLGLGVKLTTALVLPVLVWLIVQQGRRVVAPVLLGGGVGFVSIGMWGFILNLVHTGHVLGHGGGRVEVTASPSYPRSIATGLDTLYSSMDLSVLSDRLIRLSALAGLIAAGAAIAFAPRRRRLGDALSVAVPFLAPLLTIAGGAVLAFITRRWGFPIRGPDGAIGGLTRKAGEDFSGFGPIGAVTLFAVPLLTDARYLTGKADKRHLALAAAVPTFVILLSLQAKWNVFVSRFVLISVVLAAPLLAQLFRNRVTALAYLVVASIIVGLTITNVQSKPLHNFYPRPWKLTPAEALTAAGNPQVAAALTAYNRDVPPHACVGAVLGRDEPSDLLFGAHFDHHVDFLSASPTAELDALKDGLFYVVISTGPDRWVTTQFRSEGWTVHPLDTYWLLASEPHATTGTCT